MPSTRAKHFVVICRKEPFGMRIYLVRHADPDYANDTITETGHLEAKALARRMSKLPISKVHSSPLGRAWATARYTADALGLEAAIEPWTQELSELRLSDPSRGGSMIWDIPGELVRPGFDYGDRVGWADRPPFLFPAAEAAVRDIAAASDRFLSGYGYERAGERYRIVRPNRDHIAVFAHGGFGLTWIAHLLGLPVPLVWTGFWLPPSSVTTILLDERSANWAVPRCLCLGDTSHLYAEGLPIQPRGIKANFE